MTTNSPEAALATRKPGALRTYLLRVGSVSVPEGVEVPKDSLEAMLLGMRMAQKKAYEDGLVDGVGLSFEVMSSLT